MIGDRPLAFPEGKRVDTAPQELDMTLNELWCSGIHQLNPPTTRPRTPTR
ncbi:hypothetical protein SPLC1_S050660 [Arthrospira platensis C1]|uniref:Uncharacterized protein n=1 Tax=Limnospira indica PCC 8005 TaxID=376219 RepID=A0A9P1NY62_9CYAN|nr:hypothetical protein SPLC1_S050660 [Arthrospira platensis C1]CDM93516.1 hypothetical protein ARTHRO_11189 [Limnospira indica PCC 8005]